MKKGQIMEGTVERVDFPNRGIVRTNEGSVLVKNVIPGQSIRFAISKKRSGRAEGRLIEVLCPSSLESREPVCGSFPACGGCTWQSIIYEEQLILKAGQVKRLLGPVLRGTSDRKARSGEIVDTKSEAIENTESDTGYCDSINSGSDTELESIFEGIRRSPQEFSYRNKMEFSFGDEYKDGPLSLGLHRRGSRYDVLTVSDCRLVHPDMTAILRATLVFFQEREIPYYHKMTHDGILRHLLLRRAEKTGEILACLVTASGIGSEELQQYARHILSLPLDGRIVGILHMKNDSVADIVQSEKTTILYGQDYFYENLLGLRFKITPFSFFQTNSPGAEVLYSLAREFVTGKKSQVTESQPISCQKRPRVIFDLYSGTGTIAQILAPIADKVIGVEIVEEAVEAARENAAVNGLDNCRFLAGDVLKVLDTISDRPDFIVLDPPRDGIHPKALQKIIAYSVPRILYISCKPTSLARDLEILLVNGYQAERICCVDMFPQTANVETVCLLSKLHSKHHIEVELHMDEMDLTAAESKATYEEIKTYVLEHSGFKVSNLYIAQVKQKYGIIERECYNKPKSEDSRQPKCPPEKEAAITEALKYFKMI